jgi:eukaryotic-like serine/threonine-protein kinase
MGTQDRAATHTMLDASSGEEVDEARVPTIERGAIIGRYHVLERVGAGGMGVVYAAYDPDLDRKVAIKLLHHDAAEPGSLSDGRTMLLREAQAMAKLSHPNVVAVHDVGVHAGAVFMAMEFVAGSTVQQWVAERPRAWPEVLAVFVAAGRGLAAAHEAGLVHRDFKPANVMCSEDGGVKVTDFGLARGREEAGRDRDSPTDRSPAVAAAIAAATGSRSGTPTMTGAVMGTPAYMAPEQHLGLPIDARSDQFSFCVALYEALYGRRPFAADSPSGLAIAVVEGRIADPPAGTRVPGWLREVLVRGLEPDPDRRFASMQALQLELGRDRLAARRRWLLGAAAIGVLGTGVTVASLVARDSPCSDMRPHLAEIWDAQRRVTVREALFATGVGFAQSTWDRVERGLDGYTDAWVSAREDACAATLRGEQSEALMDLRMSCLDGRLRSVRALVGVLARADQTVVGNAVTMVAGLAALPPCADAVALRSAVPPPDDPAVVAELERLDERLAEAEQLGRAGKYAEGLALANELVAAAEPLAYAPMTARTLRRRGALEHVNGADADAEHTLQAAFFLAVRHDLDELAAHSAAELVTVVGEVQQRTAEARRWAEHAAALADADELLQGAVAHNLAGVALREGAYDEARELAARALELRERLLGEDHEAVLASLNMLGLIAIETGHFEEAREDFGRELAIAERTLGLDHPELAKPLNNLANVAWREGDYPAARASFERALALQRQAFGDTHRNVAQLENNLAAVAMSTGDHEEAGRRFTHALAIWREVLGPEHPLVADALNNLAVVAAARGELEQAREYDERALAIREKVMAADHPALAQNYGNLGSDLFRLGRVAEARALHERALAIYEKKLDPGHDDIAMTLTALGTDLLALGERARALPLLERALGLRAEARIDPVELASTRWALARALPAAEHRRARMLAEQALASYAVAPISPDNPRAEIEAWLASR